MMKSCETRNSTENTDPVYTLHISLKETSEEDDDSNNWPVRLE
jgi:hypothetical protein